MSLYNFHKRHTLDRLTHIYQMRMRALLRQDSEAQVREFLSHLRAGRAHIAPDIRGLPDHTARIFDDHRDRVVHVAVSDGIQEISPEQKLGLWESFPLNMPVEDTLTVSLASKRDKLVTGIKKKTIAKNTYKTRDLVESMLDSYLKNLKATYVKVAKDWFDGEESINDVIRGLQDGLRKTDSEAERIFRTETTNYFNESRHSYFSDNTSADYMEIYAVTDGRISKICEDRHEAVVTMAEAGQRKYLPAFHPHCRTIQRPLISALAFHKKIIDRGIALRAARESSWTPTAWEHRHAA